MSFLDGFWSLGRDINKVNGEHEEETREGIIDTSTPELSLEMEDSELIELSNAWKEKWDKSEARVKLEKKQKENEKYWLGDHHTPAEIESGMRQLVDNLVWEGLETSLPVWTRQAAEPVVSSDGSPEGRILAKKVQDRLIDLADVLRLRMKVRKATRHWSIYFLGVIKLGWSMERNEIMVMVKRPQQLILDPDAVTDECEYEGEYIGEYRSDTARDLIARFPAKAEFIKTQVGGEKKLGTKIRYIEFWTNDYLFWRLGGEILGKAKNPHWNYGSVEERVVNSMDAAGNPVQTTEQVPLDPGVNIFSSRKVPYAMLSIYNLGKQPFDDTNNIEQVLPLQDVVNKRQRQIDKNADNTNSGGVVSGDAFTKEQAKQAADALRDGQFVWLPRGDVNKAYKRDAGTPLPNFVYESLVDYRNEIRNIFGTQGLSAQGLKSTETVRGKIMVKSADADRATPVVDHLEQFYDYIYNWIAQLMVVYYDTPRSVNRTQGATFLVNTEFTRPIVISVKEGSLIPKDPLTKRNEAMDLWSAGATDPLTFFERLDDPNPQEATKRLILWKANPMLYAQLYAGMPAQAVAPAPSPEESPPTGGAPPEEEAPKAEPGNMLESVPIQ